MAISRAVRPQAIVHGNVERIRDLKRKADNEIYGYEVVFAQDNGARVGVTLYQNAAAKIGHFPEVGDFLAWVVSIEESRDYGASLNYEAEAYSELDKIASAATAA